MLRQPSGVCPSHITVSLLLYPPSPKSFETIVQMILRCGINATGHNAKLYHVCPASDTQESCVVRTHLQQHLASFCLSLGVATSDASVLVKGNITYSRYMEKLTRSRYRVAKAHPYAPATIALFSPIGQCTGMLRLV
jgi:hypothetical protein